MTSAYFGLTACLGLWLLANVQVDCTNLTAVLILDMSTSLCFTIRPSLHLKYSVIIFYHDCSLCGFVPTVGYN